MNDNDNHFARMNKITYVFLRRNGAQYNNLKTMFHFSEIVERTCNKENMTEMLD